MANYKLLEKDDVTGEYRYKGQWYSSYPYAEVESDMEKAEIESDTEAIKNGNINNYSICTP